MSITSNEKSSSPEKKINWKPWFFLIGFFLLPNAVFIMIYFFHTGSMTEVYQDEFEFKPFDQSLTLTLPLHSAVSPQQNDLNIEKVDLFLDSVAQELSTSEIGKLRPKQFENNVYTIIIKTRNAGELFDRIKYLLRGLGEVRNGTLQIDYGNSGENAGEPATFKIHPDSFPYR